MGLHEREVQRMPAVECPNKAINEQMCPCTEISCERHGICCACTEFHMKSTQWPLSACMRGTKRPAATLTLPKKHTEKCAQHEANLARCVCTNEKCVRRGTCCDCVRNHWGNEAGPLVSCMRGRA